MGTDLEHRTIATNGIRLHAVTAGPEDGPLVLLLHGFPEFWYGWRKQIGPLAAAGFRVVAPDQRGYNRSDKPQGVRAYRLDSVALDVIGILDHLGREKAFVAGHDWGGVAAWLLGMKHPERVERLALLNCPHPKVLEREILRNPKQLRRSSYIFFYQLPGLPERALRKDDWAYLAKALQYTSRRGTFSDEDLALYREAWSQPGAITAMLNWYRAAVRSRPRWPSPLRVPVPTLLIWGSKDRFLGKELARPSIDLCDQGRLVFVEDATHWIAHEEPERVKRLLIDHFSAA